MDYILHHINTLLADKPLLALPFAYIGGVLTSFTPCVYPMIPIIVGVIGARSSRSRVQAFLLSLCYVSGLSIVYTSLGLVSALTGSLFGRMSTSPLLNMVMANVLFLFALSMFGLFDIKLPTFFVPNIGRREGHLAAFIVGASSGFVAAPCTAPVLGTLLVYAGDTRNVVVGMLLLFVYSLGMGTLLVLIGTFTGIVTMLPKSGKWLVSIKYVLAFMMMLVAEYFVYRAGQFAGF